MLHIVSKLELLKEDRIKLFDRQHSSREWTDRRYQGKHLTSLDCEVKEINIDTRYL